MSDVKMAPLADLSIILRRMAARSDDPIVTQTLNAWADRLPEVDAEIADHDHTVELRHKADMRAIKMWHEAGGDEMVWPGTARRGDTVDDLRDWSTRRRFEAVTGKP